MRTKLKKYERGAESTGVIADGILKLAWVDVNLKESEILYSVDEFDGKTFSDDFVIKTGEWRVEDGWVVGKNPEMCPGMIVSKEDFFGDVMLEVTAKMILPSTHDINLMIHGEWDDVKNERGMAYVAGAEAFWHGMIGFEKSPEYRLTAATELFDFDPEREHIFRLGNIENKLFVMLDGKLCLEVTDPDPIDTKKYGKVGFEAFASQWKFKNVRVYRLNYTRKQEYYNPEF